MTDPMKEITALLARKAQDCPACPDCKLTTGTPSARKGSLACSACGHIWKATKDDIRQAKEAHAARSELEKRGLR